jgi:hypothetical protein
MNYRAAIPVALALAVSSACKPKSDAPAPAASAASSAAPAATAAKPALPPEPPPPQADKAAQVPGFEAALAKDAAYQAVWSGPRDNLNGFLTVVSELMAMGGVPTSISNPVDAKKLGDATTKLFLIFVRVGKFPDDFTAKFAAHLNATKAEPHLGTWSAYTKGAAHHDYTALAAWARPEDPTYLRERLSAKKPNAGPLPWESWSDKEPPQRPWLVNESTALDRLALLTTLTGDELARQQVLQAIVKKEAAAKKVEASAVRVTATELFNAYEANEVSADEKFKGKTVLVSGTVSSIDKGGLTGEAILLKLSTPNQFMSVTASMEDEEKPKAMKLAKGDSVKVLCSDGAVKALGFVQLGACVLR